MTNVDTLPLTSDDAAPVNPFAAAMFAEHFERRLDFPGRPLDGPAPRDVRSEMDAASIANTRAWLDARKDDKGEPGGIYVPPVVHDREATPEEQAWLDAHPQYAIKEGEGRDYTFVPFPSRASQEPANMTTKTEPQTNDTPARHIGNDPIPGPRPTGREQAWKNTCTQVRLFWRKSLGTSEGYDLFLGRNWVHFPGPEWRIEEALNPPLTQEAERRKVNWDIEWNAPGGRASLISLEDKGMEPISNVTTNALKNAADRKKAKDAADAKDTQPKTSEWEDHDPARFKLFFAWYNGECELRQLTDETAKNEIRRRAAQIAAGVDSFKDLPDNVTWEQLKAIVFEILKVEYTRKPTKEAWLDWLRSRGYSADYALPILSSAQQKAGGKPVDRFSDYNGELSDAERDIAAFQAERRDPPSKPQNGHSQETEHRSTDVSETTKSERSSGTNPGSSDATSIKGEIREQYTILISGQEYLKAMGRVVLWKHDHPDWTLETESVSLAPDFAVFKASIKNGEGRTVSTGHGFCTPDLAKKVSGRFVEKAETAAISRALALAGYGTDDSLDDSDYLSDSPIAKAA